MKLTIIATTVIFLLCSNQANAKDFKVGKVNKILQTDSICVSSLPGSKESMVLVDRGSNEAWVNIDGRDTRLKFYERTQINKPGKRGILKYKDKNTTLIINSRLLRTIKGELETEELSQIITVKVGSKSKTVQTDGYCS
jgi:hypothetical protein